MEPRHTKNLLQTVIKGYTNRKHKNNTLCLQRSQNKRLINAE